MLSEIGNSSALSKSHFILVALWKPPGVISVLANESPSKESSTLTWDYKKLGTGGRELTTHLYWHKNASSYFKVFLYAFFLPFHLPNSSIMKAGSQFC